MPRTLNFREVPYQIPARGDPPSWSEPLNSWREALNKNLSALCRHILFAGESQDFSSLESALDYAKSNPGYKKIVVTSSRDNIERSIKVDVIDLVIEFLPGVFYFGNPATLQGIGASEDEKNKQGSIIDVTSPGVTIIGGRIGFNSRPDSPGRNDYQHAISCSYQNPNDTSSLLTGGVDLSIFMTRFVGYNRASSAVTNIGPGLFLNTTGALAETNQRI